jgi:hypothetical protein
MKKHYPFMLFIRDIIPVKNKWALAKINQHLLSLPTHFCCFINYLLHNNDSFEQVISIAAIIKNEAPYLKEWIEYHKLIGVEKFYLYDNYSDDNTFDVLKPYIESSEVCYLKWPPAGTDAEDGAELDIIKLEKKMKPVWISPSTKIHRSEFVQVNAYNHAIRACRNKTKYLAIIDADEFIVPVQKENLVEVINEITAAHPKNSIAAMHVLWEVYGFGGNRHKPDGLVIEHYTRRTDKPATVGKMIFDRKNIGKTIVNPRVVIKYHIHEGICFWFKKRLKIGEDVLRINHYWTKSYDEFCAKMKRNHDWASDSYRPIEYDPNLLSDVEDLIAARFVPRLKERLK